MENNSSNPGAPFVSFDLSFIAELLKSTPSTAEQLNYTPSTAEPLSSTPSTAEPLSSTPSTAEPLNYTPFPSEPLSSTSFPSEGAGLMCLKDDESETIIDYPYPHPIPLSILKQFEGGIEALWDAITKVHFKDGWGPVAYTDGRFEEHWRRNSNLIKNSKLRVTYKPNVSSADAGADQEKAESKGAEEKKEDTSHEDKSATKTGDKPDSTLVKKPDSKSELKPAEAPQEKPKDQSNSTSGEAKQEEHKKTEPDSNDCCAKSYKQKREETIGQEDWIPYAYYDKSNLPTIGCGHLMVNKLKNLTQAPNRK